MAEATTKQKLGVTPARLALIAFLGVVLIAVIVVQLGGGPPQTAQAGGRGGRGASRPPAAGKKPPRPGNTTENRVETEMERLWPKYDRDTVLQHNPFARPPWTIERLEQQPVEPQPEPNEQLQTARRQEMLARMQQVGVDLVVVSENDTFAMIGDRQVRVGDVVDGFLVKAITPDGVVLVEQEAP